jgi:hypothetical protein
MRSNAVIAPRNEIKRGHREEHSDVATSWRTKIRAPRGCFGYHLAMTSKAVIAPRNDIKSGHRASNDIQSGHRGSQ